MVTQFRPAASRTPNSFLRVECLEAREVPSVGIEDVASLPHLDGMSPSYPIADATISTTTLESHIGVPLLGTTRERFAVASAAGVRTTVNVYDGKTNALLGILTPFGAADTAGARVAVGDVTGDGIQDIVVSAGPGTAPVVKVFDGRTLTEVASFLAYDESFLGGVYVAAGSVLNTGRADIVTGAGENGGPHVKLFSGRDIFPGNGVKAAVAPIAHASFFAMEADFRGGVSVAVADVNGDGYGDIVAGAGPGGGPRVVVVSGKDGSRLEDFFAYDASLRSGVMVAAGTLDATGLAKIVTLPMAGGAEVKVFDAGRVVATYQPFDANAAGTGIAVRNIDGTGRDDILVTNGRGTTPRVVVLDGSTGQKLRDFPGLTPDYVGGLFVG
jgi:hypothetical protein